MSWSNCSQNLSGLPGRCRLTDPKRGAHTTTGPPSYFALWRGNLRAPLGGAKAGGEGGIRTPVPLAWKAVFKTAAIDRSATSPMTDWICGLMDYRMNDDHPFHQSISS